MDDDKKYKSVIPLVASPRLNTNPIKRPFEQSILGRLNKVVKVSAIYLCPNKI